MNTFETELESLLNRYSKENPSHTPDRILAQYLMGCLDIFTRAIQQNFGPPIFYEVRRD